MTIRRPPWGLFAVGLVVAAAVAFAVASDLPSLTPDTPYPDARRYYLPFAGLLVEHGLAFLRDVRSAYVLPLSYVFPAVFRGDVLAIKVVGTVLHALSVLLVFRIGTNLHGRPAGATAAALFAFLPMVRLYYPTVLTEPVYLTLTLVWAWAVSELVVGRRRWAIAPAGVAFGLALLSKSVNLFFLVLLCVVLPLCAAWSRGERRRIFKDLSVAHFVALAFPAALLLHTGLAFGQWGVNGTGAVLYYALHPLFRGLDPPYYNLPFDHDVVLNGIEHASLRADALYKGVAFEMLRDWRVSGLLASVVVKAAYFMFLAPVEGGAGFHLYEYGLRVALLILAVAGLVLERKSIVAWLLGGLAAYQVAIHAALLYTHRYAVLFEVVLVLFAAIALASFAGQLASRAPAAVKVLPVTVLLAAVIGAAANQFVRSHDEPLSPDPTRFPNVPLLTLSGRELRAATAVGMETTDTGFTTRRDPAALLLAEVPMRPPPRRPAVVSVRIAVRPPAGGRCEPGAIGYRPSAGGPPPFRAPFSQFDMPEGDAPQWRHLGAPWLGDLRGRLLLVVRCPPGTQVRLTDLRLVESRVADVYRDRYLRRRAERVGGK